jgi:hypothetical protein
MSGHQKTKKQKNNKNRIFLRLARSMIYRAAIIASNDVKLRQLTSIDQFLLTSFDVNLRQLTSNDEILRRFVFFGLFRQKR